MTAIRVPSIERLASRAAATLVRFPFVLLAAGVAATGGLLGIETTEGDLHERLLVAGTLGLPLFTALALLAERRRWGQGAWLGLNLLGVVLLAAVTLAWPAWSEPVAWRRYAQLSLGFHLLVAFLPFVGTDELNGFWHHNRILFLRFLTAGIYSTVLFVGLSIALAAIDNLLGVEVAEETYLRLWVLIAFLFNTWFFLGGVPSDLAALERREDYPAALKVFTQYVLIPLVVVYLTILTIYALKVLVTWDWPRGWIGWLVSSVAVAGILGLLLVHPVRGGEGNRWIRSYGRWFYIALAPSIVLLWLAIWKRVEAYGVTENRYFLAVLAVWLGGIALYYTLTRSENIRIIPQSLCALAFVTFLGPWSAYAVSERSQVARLEGLLQEHGMLAEGRARPASSSVPFEARREVSAIVRYLAETHGTGAIEPWFDDRLAGLDEAPEAESVSRASRAEAEDRARRIVERRLDLEYVDRRAARQPDRFSFHTGRTSRAVPIAGYDYAFDWGVAGYPDSIRAGDAVLRLEADSAGIRVARDAGPALELPFAPLLDRLLASGGGGRDRVPPDSLWLAAEGAGLRVGIRFGSLAGRRTEGGPRVDSWNAEVYVGLE